MRLPTPNPAVIYKAVDGGGVLLSTTDEVYYGLNAVGSFIWEHLSPVLETLDDLCASLSGRYPDVPIETIRVDARALLNDLLASGLVRPPAGAAGDKATHEFHAGREAHQAAPRGLG